MNLNESIDFPVSIRTALFYDDSGELIKDGSAKLVVRDDKNIVYSLVSPNYNLITHREAICCFEEAMQKAGLHLPPPIYSVKALGARMMAIYRHDDVIVEIEHGDKMYMTSIITNSFDSTMAFTYEVGSYRMCCANGCRIGRSYLYCRQRHVGELNLDALAKAVSIGRSVFEQATWNMQRWVKEVMNKERVLDQVEELKLPSIMTSILRHGIETKGVLTKWTLFNILTAASTHLTSNERVAIRIENFLLSEFF